MKAPALQRDLLQVLGLTDPGEILAAVRDLKSPPKKKKKGASNSDSWCTPVAVADPLVQFFDGPVEVDPCSNEQSIIRAVRAYTFGGLHRPWCLPRPKARTCYENNPYSQGAIWTDKMLVELGNGNVLEHVRLVMASTSSDWWNRQCLATKRNPRLLFTKRLKFLDPATGEVQQGARFDSVLVYYGRRPAAFEREFRSITQWTTWGR